MTNDTVPHTGKPHSVPASKVLGALSFALDLTDGQTLGHSMQSCLVGMRIGQALHLAPAVQSDLYYALLLKDAGCSSNASKLYHLVQSDEIAAKRSSKTKDLASSTLDQVRYMFGNIAVGKPFFERIRQFTDTIRRPPETGNLIAIRCERGASIARRIGFSLEVAEAIASLDERWDGLGHPMHLVGEQIPLLARIMNLSQNIAVFWGIGGERLVVSMLKRRSRTWFDPELVRVALSLARQQQLFTGFSDTDIVETVSSLEPRGLQLGLDGEGVDRICDAFAEVIDTKSPFTFRHSAGVSKAAVAIATQLGYARHDIVQLRRAGLLHDIGKLSVPNSILEKPGKLEPGEWEIVKKHPYFTLQILKRIPGFEELSEIAASHHERLDGKGYFRSYSAADLSMPARILAAADVYDALAAARPYREALPREKVFSIMFSEAPHALDMDCLRALRDAPEASLLLPEVLRYHPESTPPPEAMPALAPHFA